jgi:predicted Zn-dependent protease with MMP-like domain
LRISRHEFDSLVSRTAERVIRSLPADLRARALEVLFATDDLPPEGLESPGEDDNDLLGLYEGTPLTERSIDYTPLLPDRITLFRLPLADMCLTPAELRREVRDTIIHELGHYFGFDEDELERLGLG